MERLAAGTATDIMLEEPHLCPHCQRLSHWFRNENGRTFCIECVLDQEELLIDRALPVNTDKPVKMKVPRSLRLSISQPIHHQEEP